MKRETRTCPECGREVALEAPEGLCPACVVKHNFGTSSPGTGRPGKIQPLSVDFVAKKFPELEILSLIGSGGMGSVYKARQSRLDRFVALKILAHDEMDSGFLERFTREAQTLARLHHPHIVAIHDFGEREGLFFFIMELVDGSTLRELMRKGTLPPEPVLTIVPPICEALHFAHENGVVHRDIKPENILVDRQGKVKVADFGIARLGGTDPLLKEPLTGEGQVVGTAHYMAPEQVEKPGEVDHRVDIYALGVVIYEMLTGELPLGRFPSPSHKVLIDGRLDDVVLRALKKEPERRFQRANEISRAVADLKNPPPMPTAAVKQPETPPTWKGRALVWLFMPFIRITGRRVLAAGLIVILVTALLGWRFGIHTDGVLDLHYGPFLPFWTFWAQGIINWIAMAGCLLPFGWWLAGNRFSLTDHFGAQALARWPYLVPMPIMALPAYRDTVEVLSMDLLAATQAVPDIAFVRDALILTALSIPPMAFGAWMIWLMYHGYSRVFGLNWKRALWSFVVALITAEILSKLIIWWLIID